MALKGLFDADSCKLGIWISIGSFVLNVMKSLQILTQFESRKFYHKFFCAFLSFSHLFLLFPAVFYLLVIPFVIETVLIVPSIYGMTQKIPMLMVPWIVVHVLDVLLQFFIIGFLMYKKNEQEFELLRIISTSVMIIIYIVLDTFFLWFALSLFRKIYKGKHNENLSSDRALSKLRIDRIDLIDPNKYMSQVSPVVELVSRIEQDNLE